MNSMTDKTIQELVNASLTKFRAEYAAAHTPAAPTPEQEIAERLAAARFREMVGDIALASGVGPAAVRHVVRDAADVFALEGTTLVPRHGATDPHDPLAPLSPQRWLEQLRVTDGYLFAAPPG